MGLNDFVCDLLDSGRVTVPAVAPISEKEIRAAGAELVERERVWRPDLPGSPPDFDIESGLWGATRLFRACQFAVFRDWNESDIRNEIGSPFGSPVSPAVHYSVDLVFRFLPDLYKMSKAASESDPLVLIMAGWAADWPLSSPGMDGIEAVDEKPLELVLQNDSLMRMYLDRVLAAKDRTRMSNPTVRQMVRNAMGSYAELDPTVYDWVTQPEQSQGPPNET